MSGLPPLDVRDDRMLPVVYRRSDIARAVSVTGTGSPQGRPEARTAATAVGPTAGRYTRSRNDSLTAVHPGNSCPKGMIIDLWA